LGYPIDALCSNTLCDAVLSALLGRAHDSMICHWVVAFVTSSAATDCAFLIASSFDDPWMFDTGTTTHMAVKFADVAAFKSFPLTLVNGLSAYVVGEGIVHLFPHDDTCSPIRVKLDHCLYVPDLIAKTNDNI
jgi:hypothetical protein